MRFGPGAPGKANRSERGVKVLERPRREDVDTAAWQPELLTGADGKTRFTFKMPDSLTRWRITARAIADDGQVGQKKQFVRSEKPLYLKWSGPSKFRKGDQPQLGVFAFSQAEKPVKAELVTHYAGVEQRLPVTLNNGINYLPLPAFALDEKDLLPVDQAFALTATAPERGQVQLQFKIAPGYYLYRHRTSVKADPTFNAGALQMPAGKKHHDDFFGEVETYRERLTALLPGKADDDTDTVTLEVRYQGCADAGVCYPPQTQTVNVELPAAGSVLLGARRAGGHLRLAVCDTGPGIAPDQQALIFEEFRRLDTRSQGKGLGLAIVKHIVARHHGTLSIKSQPGQGTRVDVSLPG